MLRLLHWLRDHTGLQLHVLLRGSGELQRDFASVASVFIVPRLPWIPAGILRRLSGETKVRQLEDLLLRCRVRRLRPALIYANTITNTREVAALAPLGIPILCHVHEMEYWIRHELGLNLAAAAVPFIRRFVAAGPAVARGLERTLGIDAQRIDVVDVFPLSLPPAREQLPELRNAARRALSLTDDTFVVGACGTVDWRKGADLFLAIARAFARLAGDRRCRFLWVGGPVEGKFFAQLQHDLAHSGLSGLVAFVGPVPAADQYYAAMDAFVVTSREDCGPMVMLEAAGYNVPILCFDGSGGAPGFVAEGAGIAVPYLDLQPMAEALLALADAPLRREQLGAQAFKRLRERHDADTQCAELCAAMSRTQPLLAAALHP